MGISKARKKSAKAVGKQKQKKKSKSSAARTSSQTILTDDLIRAFCRLICRGLPVDGVCDYLSINATTFYSWMRKGTEYDDAAEDERPEEFFLYSDFVRRFKRATGRYRLRMVKSLHRKAPGKTWIRDLAVLERRDRKNFGRNEQPGGGDQQYEPDERFL